MLLVSPCCSLDLASAGSVCLSRVHAVGGFSESFSRYGGVQRVFYHQRALSLARPLTSIMTYRPRADWSVSCRWCTRCRSYARACFGFVRLINNKVPVCWGAGVWRGWLGEWTEKLDYTSPDFAINDHYLSSSYENLDKRHLKAGFTLEVRVTAVFVCVTTVDLTVCPMSIASCANAKAPGSISLYLLIRDVYIPPSRC